MLHNARGVDKGLNTDNCKLAWKVYGPTLLALREGGMSNLQK